MKMLLQTNYHNNMNDITAYSSVASGSAALFDLAAFLRLVDDLLDAADDDDVMGGLVFALCL